MAKALKISKQAGKQFGFCMVVLTVIVVPHWLISLIAPLPGF
ncbi:hypothetical protein ACTXM3_08510 [Glutamicibacter arilaitensis]